MMYERYRLREELNIRQIITFYYMELTKNHLVMGEKHDFWELVYVDKGDLEVHTDSNCYHLSQGDIVFYKPDEFHGGQARNGTAPNLIIVSFECDSPCMDFFAGKFIRLGENERTILANLVQEGLQAFDPPIDSPRMRRPQRKEDAPFGCEHLIKNYLEILLIGLIRADGKTGSGEQRLLSVSGERMERDMAAQVIDYAKRNLLRAWTLDDLCKELAVSRTRLKTAFKAQTGFGIMEYCNKLRIDRAKQIIREEQCNVTEIAERLGYSSVHYFSRHFKQATGMKPTEYARSVSARSRRGEQEEC